MAPIKEGGGLASVLEHCMYCGMSLGRVGLDFRGLLPPIFEACILGLFSSLVQVCPVNFDPSHRGTTENYGKLTIGNTVYSLMQHDDWNCNPNDLLKPV